MGGGGGSRFLRNFWSHTVTRKNILGLLGGSGGMLSRTI